MKRKSIRRWRLLTGAVVLIFILGFALDGLAQMDSQTKLMTRRAAKVDALRNLLEIVYGIQIDARTMVRDFVTQSDVVRSRVRAVVQGAQEVDYQIQADGTAEVTVELTLGRLEDILGRRLHYDQEVIQAKGYGAPGGQGYGAPSPGGQGYGVPQAGRDVLRVKGYGIEPNNDPGMTAAEKSLLAKRAGKLDALRNLSEQVNGVRVSGETLVRDFVTRSDDIRSRVSSYIRGARVISEYQLADGSYEVEVEIDLEPLRRILGVR
jgi:hypothetical protein